MNNRSRNFQQSMSHEQDIRALEDCMRRWGIDPARNEAHRMYWQTMKDLTRDFVHGTGASKLKYYKDSTLMSLPRNPDQALSMFCRESIHRTVSSMEIMNEEERAEGYLVIIVDLLREAYPSIRFGSAPYDRPASFCYDTYALKPEFYAVENDNALLLDPFLRFSPKSTDSIEDLMRQQYLDGSPASIGSCNALLVSGLVCHAACNTHTSIKCIACNRPNSLKWNGGHFDSVIWRKMECFHCGAIYEIKTVGNVRKYLDHPKPRIENGTVFHAYHHWRREQPGRQMFLVMVDSRSFKEASRPMGDCPYPPKICTYVGKINHVAPFLKPSSFVHGYGASTYKIYTKIFLQHVTPWFDISLENYPDELRHPVQSYVEKVMDDYFCNPEDDYKESHCPEEDERGQNEANEDSDNNDASRIESMSFETLSSYFVELRMKRARIAFLENIEPESRSAEDTKLLASLEELDSEIFLCEEAHRKFM